MASIPSWVEQNTINKHWTKPKVQSIMDKTGTHHFYYYYYYYYNKMIIYFQITGTPVEMTTSLPSVISTTLTEH